MSNRYNFFSISPTSWTPAHRYTSAERSSLALVQALRSSCANADHLKLHASITINGTLFHAVAIAVLMHSREQCQIPVCLHHDEEFDDLSHTHGGDGPFQTIPLYEHDYVVFISPHCR